MSTVYNNIYTMVKQLKYIIRKLTNKVIIDLNITSIQLSSLRHS